MTATHDSDMICAAIDRVGNAGDDYLDLMALADHMEEVGDPLAPWLRKVARSGTRPLVSSNGMSSWTRRGKSRETAPCLIPERHFRHLKTSGYGVQPVGATMLYERRSYAILAYATSLMMESTHAD